jgi:hypothetical protein
LATRGDLRDKRVDVSVTPGIKWKQKVAEWLFTST